MNSLSAKATTEPGRVVLRLTRDDGNAVDIDLTAEAAQAIGVELIRQALVAECKAAAGPVPGGAVGDA